MMRMNVTGNLVRDPEIKFTNSGKAVCEITIADNYKPNKEAEDQVSYVDVTLWGTLAENFANSMKKGQRVFAEGRVQQQNWEKDEVKHSKLKLIADSAGPDLRFQTANVTNVGKRESAPARVFDEEPF